VFHSTHSTYHLSVLVQLLKHKHVVNAVCGALVVLQLFNGATLALLDEATSALEEEAERELYQLLMNMPGLTVVST
jgi:ABC-type uncharacterized transport system ATPase subunit